MTGLGGHEGDLNRGAITHFAYQNYFWRLAQSRAQSVGIIVKIVAEFALIECRLELWMHKLDRVLKGDDMNGLFLVNLIEDGCERSRFSASCGTRYQNQACFFRSHFAKEWW